MKEIYCPDGFIFSMEENMENMENSMLSSYSIWIDDKEFCLHHPIFQHFILWYGFTPDNNPFPVIFNNDYVRENIRKDRDKLGVKDIEKYIGNIYDAMISEIKHFTTLTGLTEMCISDHNVLTIMMDDSHHIFQVELDYIQRHYPQVPIVFSTGKLIRA